MEAERPYVTVFHVGEMLEGFDKLRASAPSRQHIVPGHAPLVMQKRSRRHCRSTGRAAKSFLRVKAKLDRSQPAVNIFDLRFGYVETSDVLS
jgi:hypothetical protein